jgi:hypothetical protein
MNVLSLDSRLHPREQILKQEAAGTVVLLTLDEGRYYALDDPGGRAWECCNGERTIAQIAGLLADEYDASRAEIERDLLELFTDLANESLLVENSQAAQSA